MSADAVLLTAATPWECRPLAKALGLLPDGPGLWSGSLGARRGVLLETGMGGPAASAALDRVFGTANGSTPGLLVSTGLCGALLPELKTGDLVVDVHGGPAAFALAAFPAAKRAGVTLHIGAVADADHVLTSAEKRALGAKVRAAAVDMESAAVRAWAARRGSAFVAARAVLDGLGEDAPSAAPEDGSFAAALRFAASHWSELPLLMATGWKARRGMDALGRFLSEYLGDLDEHAEAAE
jgi:nucleoside phosphorylase